MNRRWNLLVLDWDGTVVDSAAHIIHAVQTACRDVSLPVPAAEAVRASIGLGMREAWARVAPEAGEADYARFLAAYRERFHAGMDGATPDLFPRVGKAIEHLRQAGYLLAVATGKGRRGLDRALRETGLERLVVTSRCADEAFSKPHPGMLEQILDELGMDRAEALMVGDTEFDLMMAANAGVLSVGVTCGAHPADRLAACGPLALLDSLADLPAWLESDGSGQIKAKSAQERGECDQR
ncbi:MAG: HAD-IA family hydrolase [Gammaproteobacteria bacterium]|jgi:phosphoglycolate phosphatase